MRTLTRTRFRSTTHSYELRQEGTQFFNYSDISAKHLNNLFFRFVSLHYILGKSEIKKINKLKK